MILASLLAQAAIVAAPPSPTVDDPCVPIAETIGFLPRGLTSFGARCHDGWLYVLGGYYGLPHDYSIEGQSAAFFRINLRDTRDLRMFADVEPVQSVELVRFRDRLIRVGGLHARNTADEPTHLESTDEVAAFDPGTEEWTALPSLPKPRSSHRAIVVGDQLYVVGGWILDGRGSRDSEWHSTVDVLDLAAWLRGNEVAWRSIDTDFRARALGVAEADGHLYVIGGITPDAGVTEDVRVLCLVDEVWTEGVEYPDSGFGITATSLDGAVVASGTSGDVFRFEPQASRWAHVCDLRTGRIFHELVRGPANSLLALGGIAGMQVSGRIRGIERIDFDAPPSFAAIERFEVPTPLTAYANYALLEKRGSLYFFGGDTADAWRFVINDRTWTRLTTMPVARKSMEASFREDGALGMLVGGFEDATVRPGSLIYDFEFEDWSEGPALPASRSDFGLVHHGEAHWVFGGATVEDDAATLHPVPRLADGADAYETTDLVPPTARRSFAGAVLGDHYVMVGGLDGDGTVAAELIAFDFDGQRWDTAPGPATSRIDADLVAVEGALYLVGGFELDRDGRRVPCRSIERLESVHGPWTTVVDDVGIDMTHARTVASNGALVVTSITGTDGHMDLVTIRTAGLDGNVRSTEARTTHDN